MLIRQNPNIIFSSKLAPIINVLKLRSQFGREKNTCLIMLFSLSNCDFSFATFMMLGANFEEIIILGSEHFRRSRGKIPLLFSSKLAPIITVLKLRSQFGREKNICLIILFSFSNCDFTFVTFMMMLGANFEEKIILRSGHFRRSYGKISILFSPRNWYQSLMR